MFDLTEKVALISGASRGIGAAIAQALAFASGGKVLSIPSPMVLAMTAFEHVKQSHWWVSVKSRKNLFYLAQYKILFFD